MLGSTAFLCDIMRMTPEQLAAVLDDPERIDRGASRYGADWVRAWTERELKRGRA